MTIGGCLECVHTGRQEHSARDPHLNNRRPRVRRCRSGGGHDGIVFIDVAELEGEVQQHVCLIRRLGQSVSLYLQARVSDQGQYPGGFVDAKNKVNKHRRLGKFSFNKMAHLEFI